MAGTVYKVFRSCFGVISNQILQSEGGYQKIYFESFLQFHWLDHLVGDFIQQAWNIDDSYGAELKQTQSVTFWARNSLCMWRHCIVIQIR